MLPQEREIFKDGSSYISNTRVMLRNGGVYPVANLSQVTLGRVAGNRFWIVGLVIGLLALILGAGSGQDIVKWAGVALMVISLISAVVQAALPAYVVLLRGTFGTAQPLKRRNRRYIERVVSAISQAMSMRNESGPIFIDNSITGSFNNSSGNAVGHGAQVTWSTDPTRDNRISHRPWGV